MSTGTARVWPVAEREELEREIKQLIVSSLNLVDLTPDVLDTDAPLFEDGFGLDSIDAIQLVAELRRVYGVSLGPDDEQTRSQLSSVRTIADVVGRRDLLGDQT